MGKKLVLSTRSPERKNDPLSYGELAAAGFFSAVPTTFVAAPVERVKVLLQMQGQGGEQLYNGPVDAVKKLYREGGLRSIFRGTGATLARDGPGSAASVYRSYRPDELLLTRVGDQGTLWRTRSSRRR